MLKSFQTFGQSKKWYHIGNVFRDAKEGFDFLMPNKTQTHSTGSYSMLLFCLRETASIQWWGRHPFCILISMAVLHSEWYHVATPVPNRDVGITCCGREASAGFKVSRVSSVPIINDPSVHPNATKCELEILQKATDINRLTVTSLTSITCSISFPSDAQSRLPHTASGCKCHQQIW